MTEAPSRYSVSQPDFDWEIGRRLKIYVDGVLQDKVIEYDCGAGTVLKYVLDADGNYMVNEKRDEAVSETVRGKVTVELVDG